tara:strand:+ start:597 stop:1016 length:420 start_codon:yes stop_codon:yes gene_type:complete
MKVKGLNGRDYTIPLKKYMGNDRSKVSFYHLQAREIIQDMFSGYSILEEVKLPGTVNPSKRSALFIDFLIPNLKIGVEVHGQQHFKYTPFFHKSKAGFMKARARDRDKSEWCEINHIELAVLRYDSSPEYWRKQLELCR